MLSLISASRSLCRSSAQADAQSRHCSTHACKSVSAIHVLTHPFQNLNLNMNLNSYYKGGFEEKMSRREAGLILGVR